MGTALILKNVDLELKTSFDQLKNIYNNGFQVYQNKTNSSYK